MINASSQVIQDEEIVPVDSGEKTMSPPKPIERQDTGESYTRTTREFGGQSLE